VTLAQSHASEASADGTPARDRTGPDRPLRAPPQPPPRRGVGRRRRGDRPTSSTPTAASAASSAACRLKVKDDRRSSGSSPVRLPVQRGQALPEGREALPAGVHPDRLLEPLERDPSAAPRLPPVGWDHALTAPSPRSAHPGRARPDAFAMLSGVSLTNEKSYLIGKFARLALGTANLDYNGRLCMVSAGAANKKALGHRPGGQPVVGHPARRRRLRRRRQHRRVRPITTSYIWRARDNGAKLIVMDPRVTPIARTADVFLGCDPGPTRRCSARDPPRAHRERDWLDHDFIEHTPSGSRRPPRRSPTPPPSGRRGHRRPRRPDRAGGRAVGDVETGMLLHARGIEHHTKGVDNVLAASTSGWPPASTASRAAG
jgi:assimilatory nitrate reductase catalytic subunit